MSLKRFKKIISAVLCLDLIFQSFLPLLVVPVYASEDLAVSEFVASDSAIVSETEIPLEPTAVLTPEPTLELTSELTLESALFLKLSWSQLKHHQLGHLKMLNLAGSI
jgi:hypothetical protein